MGRIYNVFDKFCILDIVCGFLFGLYLAIYHDNSQLWEISILFVLLFSFLMTLAPLISAIYAKFKYSDSFPVKSLIEAFILNVGMTAVSLAFAFVIGSILIGNYIPDEGKLMDFINH